MASDEIDRAALRSAIRAAHPWVTSTELGPQAVSAGECDVCGEEARLVQPCGPPPPQGTGPDWALGRRCALDAGVEGWCDGHEEEALEALEWLQALPDDADRIARLWWLATGEVRPDPALVGHARALLAGA